MKKIEKTSLKGIGLASQIIPNTSDNVQVQARYVQVTPDTTDLSNILGMSGITGSASGGCANNLYEVLAGVNTNISSIKSNYVPYTNATKNLQLGSSYYVGARGFYLPATMACRGSGITIQDSRDSGIKLLINYRSYPDSDYNCISLEDLYTNVGLVVPGIGSGISLFSCLTSLNSKINNITNPLRFMGTVNNAGDLPTSNVSKGDVYHFNEDVEVGGAKYYAGDDVVCISVSSSGTPTWDLLGANVTRIDPREISEDNLNSWLNSQ